MAEGGKCIHCYKYGSTSHCAVCNTFHCRICVKKHIEDPHKKYEIKKYEITSIIFDCEDHKRSPCLHYCKSCATAVCVYCIVEAHKDHRDQLITIEKVWSKKKAEMEAFNQETRNNTSDKLVEKVKQKWLQKVDEAVAFTKEGMRQHKKKMEERLKDLIDAKQSMDLGDTIPVLKSKKESEILTVDKHFRNVLSEAISNLKDEIDKVFNETFSEFYGNGDPKNVQDIDINVESLWDITCDDQKRIFCSAKNASTLFRIDENQRMKIHGRTTETQGHIAFSPMSAFLYFTSTNQILTMPVDKTENIEASEFFRVEDGWQPYGLAVTPSNTVLLCLSAEREGKILRISTDGKVVDEYQHQNSTEKKPLFTKPLYVAENYASGNVCVSDNFEKVLSITKAKTVHFTYKGIKNDRMNSFGPRGIGFDSYTRLYISDFANNCVHRLDKNGAILNLIGKGKLYMPTGLCLDHEDRILVTEFENRRIKIIEMR